MSDFKSHLPVQTHKDGATFTPSSDYVVGVGGYESTSGDLLMAAVTASREWLVSNSTLESVVYAEDSAHSTADPGTFFLAVRNDTLSSLVDTDGDYTGLQVNATGQLYTIDTGANTKLTAIQTAVELIDDIVLVEDTAHTTGDKGVMPLAVRNDSGSALADTDGDYIPLSTDALGNLRVAVAPTGATATKISDYKTSASLAVGATATHDYTVTAGKTLYVRKIRVSASGRVKMNFIIDPAGTPSTKFTDFNSTANHAIVIDVDEDIEVAAGTVVRIEIINDDEDAQDVYSTLLGREN